MNRRAFLARIGQAIAAPVLFLADLALVLSGSRYAILRGDPAPPAGDERAPQ